MARTTCGCAVVNLYTKIVLLSAFLGTLWQGENVRPRLASPAGPFSHFWHKFVVSSAHGFRIVKTPQSNKFTAMNTSQLMNSGNLIYYVITIGAMLLSRWVGSMLQKRFAEYSNRPIALTGAQIAEKMLQDSGIDDVQIISTPGQLTDHYNPLKKTVNLSEVVYNQSNVAAAAVSAHEVGHAIQHARSYGALKMRSALVPVVNLASKYMQWVLMAGLFLAASGRPELLWVGVILFGTTTLFSVITLPVEFDASKRALAWLDDSHVMQGVDHEKAKNALFWAAMTYTVAAIASIGQLLYYIMRLMAARR